MKNIIIAVIFGIALGNTAPAYAASCKATGCFNISSELGGDHCVSETAECYNGTRVHSCNECEVGYIATTRYYDGSDGCQTAYTACCAGWCSNCESTDWTSAGGGYETKTTATCDCGTCRRHTEYRCAAGYYGSPASAQYGCNSCPGGGTSSAGSGSISDCYVTSFSDDTGSGYYSGNCYYN